jgi:hypothetical protein
LVSLKILNISAHSIKVLKVCGVLIPTINNPLKLKNDKSKKKIEAILITGCGGL